jgi:hypothetical protein
MGPAILSSQRSTGELVTLGALERRRDLTSTAGDYRTLAGCCWLIYTVTVNSYGLALIYVADRCLRASGKPRRRKLGFGRRSIGASRKSRGGVPVE